MLLNSDTIKKRTILFDEANEYFTDDGEHIYFENIIAFYHQETAQITNSVYEGTKLVFTLILKYHPKPYIIKIDSNKEEKYKLIYTLSNAIAQYRSKKILEVLESTKKSEFQTLRDCKLLFHDGILELHYTNKKSHYQPFVINCVKLQKNLLVFSDNENQEELFYANSISDIGVFLQIISHEPFFSDETKALKKRDTKLYFLLLALMVLFTINGYFEICCMENDFVEFASDLSQFLLTLALFLSPLYWIVDKLNRKKIQKEME